MKSKKSRIIIGVILGIIVLAGLFLSLVNFIVDFLWFKELNYLDVFFKELFTKLKIGIPCFIIFFIIIFIIQRLLKRKVLKKSSDSESITISKRLQNIGLVLTAIIFSIIITINIVNGLWWKILQFGSSTAFDMKDPIFKQDVSFYMFKLDLIKDIPMQIIFTSVVLLISFLVSFFIISVTTKGIKLNEQTTESKADFRQSAFGKNIESILSNLLGKNFTFRNAPQGISVKRQFSFSDVFSLLKVEILILISIVCLMLSITFFLMQYDLLYTESEVLFGAGWTDLHIWLWVYRVLAFFSIVAAITIPVAVLKRKTKLGVAVPVIMVAIFLIGSLSAMIVQNIIVAPDAIDKEGPYLKNNIEFTQKAYDLNKVSIKDFKAEDNLTSKDIQNNDATFKNIRINDYQQAQKFYNQVQNIRRYYYFNDVDVDRYTINGEYTQTFLSAREIDESKVDNQWINKHIKYTHGYGATISRVDKVTDNGQPDVMVKDIPPKSSFKELEITQPGIYFGELTNNYILVDTKEDEFDYPDGSTNIYTKYEGNAGIKLNFFNRVLFSIKERSLKLLVSSNIDKNSKIVINRNIQARVSKIMPKLSYSDPYAITVNGKLYWIIDGYTSSTNFPYSEPLSEAGGNYIRNSVKVVIDAYNGDTVYYLVDNKDPVANTVKKIYPTLFQSADKMPAEIKEHIRYPHTMLKIQSEIYRRYHVNDVKVFYQQEDTWSVSNELSGTEEITMTPSYYILKLPGEKKEEFVSSIPYTPKDKKNMTGLLVARNDGDNYGELVLYQFPKTRTILGPMQIEAQINQDTTISKEFSLWDNSGSSYSRGNLFVIPVEDSLCYVEPIYLEASNSSLPEVKRVIVYYKNRISYKPTLAEALDDMFGSGSSALFDEKADSNDNTNKNAEKVKTRSELIQEASDLYEDAQADLKKGDLGGYADKVDKIGKLLGELGASQADADDENLGT